MLVNHKIPCTIHSTKLSPAVVFHHIFCWKGRDNI